MARTRAQAIVKMYKHKFSMAYMAEDVANKKKAVVLEESLEEYQNCMLNAAHKTHS